MSDAAQLVLFAPYCGGVSRQQDLPQPCRSWAVGHWRGGFRWPGSDGHPYKLRWNGVAAPLERLDCQLRFPCHPEGVLDFAVDTHQLVVWLMDCSYLQPSEPDLPNGFWQWLLIERGDAPEQA